MNIKRNKKYDNFIFQDYVSECNSYSNNYIDCSLGVNPFLKEIKLNNVYLKNCYPEGNYEKLKESICKKYESINKENIAFGTGTMGILKQLFSILLEEKTIVLGVSPQFSRIKSEIEFLDAIYETVPLDKKKNFEFNCKELIKKISDRYRLIYIDNPNNPTGQVISLKDIEKITKTAAKYNIPVIIDEAYGDYIPNEQSAINLVLKYKNIFVCKSASKTYGMADCRVGYLISDYENINFYNKLSTPFPFSTNASNIFAKLLLKYNIKRDIIKVAKAKKELMDLLSKKYIILKTDKYTPIFCIKSKKENCDLCKELLEKYNILTESCKVFKSLDSQYVRIRVPKNYKKMIKIIKKIDKRV